MKHLSVMPKEGFAVLAGTARSQAAIMVLGAKDATGGADNKHPESDQWLYVLEGQGKAVVAGEEVALAPGSLLLIEAGEAHEIINTGDTPLETLNIYAPPEY